MSDRLWVNKEVLLGSVFKSVVHEVINPMRTRFSLALIGGLAVAHYANPPATVDIDLLVAVDSVDPVTTPPRERGGFFSKRAYERSH